MMLVQQIQLQLGMALLPQLHPLQQAAQPPVGEQKATKTGLYQITYLRQRTGGKTPPRFF